MVPASVGNVVVLETVDWPLALRTGRADGDGDNMVTTYNTVIQNLVKYVVENITRNHTSMDRGRETFFEKLRIQNQDA